MIYKKAFGFKKKYFRSSGSAPAGHNKLLRKYIYGVLSQNLILQQGNTASHQGLAAAF